jgi:hypothetical protein
MKLDIDEQYSSHANASESAMQAAGRLPSQTYSDLRSARRAFQRTRKYPQKQSRDTYSKRCCSASYHGTRLSRKADIHHTLQSKPWHEDFAGEQRWHEDYDAMDEVVKYTRFGRWTDGVQDAEDFGAWGRRRINEMRACKEERIRRAANQASCAPLATTAPETTLPITQLDMHAHALLHSMLTPLKREFSYWRAKRQPPFLTIYGFDWFGEYAWAWHRNESGCWELGYADCGECPFPCPCCCSGNGSMYYPCSCADFKDEEGRWVGPAPEDVQSCSLIEWVRGRLWEVMVEEEMEEQVRQGADGRVEEEEEWEMLSNVTSQDWSVLSQDSESEMMIV